MAFPPKAIRGAWNLADRERKALLSEMVQVRGLMPLLMKPRNKQKWSDADRRELHVHLKRLTELSPYIVVFVMPGGFAMLPLLAWWLDRRRQRSRVAAASAGPSAVPPAVPSAVPSAVLPAVQRTVPPGAATDERGP